MRLLSVPAFMNLEREASECCCPCVKFYTGQPPAHAQCSDCTWTRSFTLDEWVTTDLQRVWPHSRSTTEGLRFKNPWSPFFISSANVSSQYLKFIEYLTKCGHPSPAHLQIKNVQMNKKLRLASEMAHRVKVPGCNHVHMVKGKKRLLKAVLRHRCTDTHRETYTQGNVKKIKVETYWKV